MTTPGPQGSMAPPQHDSNPSQGPPFNTGNPSHPQQPPGGGSNQNSSLSNRLTSLNEQIWVQFGTSFELASEFDKAINAYEQALRHNPYSTNALQKIAMLYRSRECYDKAVDYFQRLLNINKSNGEAWGCLGHSYLMMDDLPKAYAAYQQALHFSEENEPRLWYGIGILYDRYGSLEHAESAFSSVIQGDPNFDKANEIYFRLGIIYKNQNKLDLSLQCFRYILNSPPKPLTEVDIWFQIGHVYEHQREYELAKEAYERVIQENPSHAKVLQQLGWLHQQQNTSFYNQEHAITLLNRSLDSDPSDAQTWYLLGRCYMSQQKFDKAYEAYQQAVYRDGRNPTFWCSIGVLYYQINQFRDALDAYSRAIRLNPYISEVWYDLGTLYESCNNQINDAIDAYQRASDLDPSNPHIKQRLAALRNSQAGGNGEGLGNENGIGSLPPGPQGPPPGVQSYPSHIPDNSKNIPPPLRRFNGELPPPGPGSLVDPPKANQGNPFAKSQYGPPGHHRDDDPRMADSGPPSRPDLPRMASPHPMDHPYGSGMPQDQRMRSMKPDPLAPMVHQTSDGRKMSIPINMAGRHPNPPPHHNNSLPPPRGNPDYPPYPGQEPSHHHSRLGHPPPRGDFDEYSRGAPYSGRPHPHQEPGYPGEPNSAYPHHPIISDPRRPSTGGPRGVPPSHPGHEEYGHHSSMHLPDIRSMERQGKPPSSAPWPHTNAMGHGGEHHYNRSEVSPKSMMPPSHRPPTRHIDDDYDRAVNALVSIRGQSGKMQQHPPRRSPSAKPNDPHLKSHPNKPMSMGSNLSPATHSRHATPLPSRSGPYHSKPGNDGSEPPNLPPSQP